MRVRFSAGSAAAGINLAASVALVAATVLTPFALLSTRFSLGQIRRIIDMQLDLHVSSVESAVDSQPRAIAGHYATLVQARVLPSGRGDEETMAVLYWGHRRLRHRLLRVCYRFPGDRGRFVDVLSASPEGPVVLSLGVGTADVATAAASVVRYRPAETDAGVAFAWVRNDTLPASEVPAGQLERPVAHSVEASAGTGELVVVYAVRLCSDGSACGPEAAGQAGVLQLVATTADMSRSLRGSLSAGADPGARAFVTDESGRLVAVSHGTPWVRANGTAQYLMCGNESIGDATTAMVGRDLLAAGKQGEEIGMHRTGTHIVSSKRIVVGNAGTVWTVYYAVPSHTVYGELNRTVGICAGIAGSLALLAAAVLWGIQYALLTRPLLGAARAINMLALLNIAGITDASRAVKESSIPCVQGASTADEPPAAVRQRSNVLDEVSEVLQAADKMMHSLYCVGRYLSIDLASWVISNGITSSPLQPRDVSVLFCDIEGSAEMVRGCNDESTTREFAQLLKEVLASLTNAVKQHGGFVDKYIGDRLMAVFNAPRSCPKHESQACEAAVDMVRSVAMLHALWEADGKYRNFGCPKVVVTVASGTAHIGDIGAHGTLISYTAVGDVVCTAARLQDAAKSIKPPNGILYVESGYLQALRSAALAAVRKQRQSEPGHIVLDLASK
eukprot:m51a1_g12263 putative adenylate guanylate cyclase catalytic domain protein (674) ;mRNA; r:190014-192354